MFLVRVACGCVDQRTAIDRSIRHAPPGHHSVRGPVRGEQHAFVVYRAYQAYPEYIVTYRYTKPA